MTYNIQQINHRQFNYNQVLIHSTRFDKVFIGISQQKSPCILS